MSTSSGGSSETAAKVTDRPTGSGHGRYKQELSRTLSVVNNAVITLSTTTPATSVFVIVPVLFVIAGSGTFLALLIAAGIGLAMAFCWAELGAAYPIVGGDYALVRRVLGRAAGFLTLVLSGPVQAILIPAVVALGMSQYLGVIFTSDPEVMAAIVMGVASVIAILGIRLNAFVTGTFLCIELIALGVVSVLGLVNANQPVSELFSPHVFAGDGATSSLTAGLLISGVSIALFAYNGYQLPITLSEETRGPRRGIARAIIWALVITATAEIIPVTAALLGTPSLESLTTDASPMQYLVTTLGGDTLNTVISLAVAGAIFNAAIAVLLFYPRVLYSSGRDLAWPKPISRALATVHPRFQTPWIATAVTGMVGIVIVLTTDIFTISTWVGVALALDYALVALAALVSRMTQPQLDRPYRMPLWPAAPLLALAGCVVVLTKQTEDDLRTGAIVVVASLLYYYLYLHPRQKTHWLMLDPVKERDPLDPRGASRATG